MSIKSLIGNKASSIKESISEVLNKTQKNLSNIISSSSVSPNLYGNGFVGMKEEGMEDLYEAIRKYIRQLEDTIDEYSYEENLIGAYKGDIQDKVREFLESSKKILKSYVATLNKDIEEAQSAYATYLEAQANIALDTSSDADEIRSEANKIDL